MPNADSSNELESSTVVGQICTLQRGTNRQYKQIGTRNNQKKKVKRVNLNHFLKHISGLSRKVLYCIAEPVLPVNTRLNYNSCDVCASRIELTDALGSTDIQQPLQTKLKTLPSQQPPFLLPPFLSQPSSSVSPSSHAPFSINTKSRNSQDKSTVRSQSEDVPAFSQEQSNWSKDIELLQIFLFSLIPSNSKHTLKNNNNNSTHNKGNTHEDIITIKLTYHFIPLHQTSNSTERSGEAGNPRQ